MADSRELSSPGGPGFENFSVTPQSPSIYVLCHVCDGMYPSHWPDELQMCGHVQPPCTMSASAAYRSTEVLHNPHDVSRKQSNGRLHVSQIQSQTQALSDGERSLRNRTHGREDEEAKRSYENINQIQVLCGLTSTRVIKGVLVARPQSSIQAYFESGLDQGNSRDNERKTLVYK